MSRAATIANVAQRLADRTKRWRNATPSLGAVLEAQEVADEITRRLVYLADGEPLGHHKATAADLAAAASRTARALHALAAGWPRAIPDREAIADTQRLASHLLRELARLASLPPKDDSEHDH